MGRIFEGLRFVRMSRGQATQVGELAPSIGIGVKYMMSRFQSCTLKYESIQVYAQISLLYIIYQI